MAGSQKHKERSRRSNRQHQAQAYSGKSMLIGKRAGKIGKSLGLLQGKKEAKRAITKPRETRKRGSENEVCS